MVVADQGRVDASRHALRAVGVVDALADREQLDREALCRGGLDHVRAHRRDALDVDVVHGHRDLECERGDDRRLRCGIETLDVRRRVGLRVPQFLRGRERRVEVPPLLGHLVEDVVRRPVDDPHDALDPVAGERHGQRTDDRDRSCDGRFVLDAYAGILRRGDELREVLCEQRLVRGDDAGTRCERVEDVGAGGFDAAHQLDDDVRSGDHRLGVGRDQLARDAVPLLRRVPDQDTRQFEPRAHARGQRVAPREEGPRDLRADDSSAQQGDSELLHGGPLRHRRSDRSHGPADRRGFQVG